MTYLDPLQLLQLSVPRSGVPSEEDIRRAKRKLMAEFELAGTVTIHRLGRDIDRSTALRAVESLEDPATLANWVALHRLPAVRAFLENPQAKDVQKLPAVAILPPGALREFAMGVMASAFAAMMDRAVRKFDWPAVLNILSRIEWVRWDDESNVLQPLLRHLNAMTNHFQALRTATEAEAKAQWNAADYPVELFAALNLLPEAYTAQRTTLAIQIYNACFHLAESLYIYSQPRVLTSRALLLRMPADLRETIRDLHAHVHAQTRSKRETSEAFRKHGLDGIQIIQILIGLFMLITFIQKCTGCKGPGAATTKSPRHLQTFPHSP